MFRPKLDTSKFAIVYPRQSTGDQVQNNIYSLERQMQLKDQALRDGFPEDAVMVVDDDLGVSGRSIERRQGFSRALRLIEQKVVAAIYVEDLTRLSRDERTIDQMIIADACERSGTLIYMGRSWYDMRDSGQRQSYKYQAVGGSEYWKAHVEKLRETKKEKARQGKAVSHAPRGYRVNKQGKKHDHERDRLVIYEPEAEVIRALVALLPEAGSFSELYRRTNPTYWPDGTAISYSHLYKILKHQIYRGSYVWGDIHVENAHPAIIEPEQAAMVDRLLSTNRTTKRKPGTKSNALLSGILWCPGCKRRVRSNVTHQYSSYRCIEASRPGEFGYHFQIQARVLDDLVLQELWRRMHQGLAAEIISAIERQKAISEAAQDTGISNRAALERKIAGLTKSLSDPDVTDVVRKMLLLQLDHVARELEALDRQRPINKHLDVDLSFYMKLRANRGFLDALILTWEDEPLAWRRSWIRHFFDRVEVDSQGHGTFEIRVYFLDGQTSTLPYYRKPDWQPEETELLRSLWLSPDRPSWRWNQWIRDRMALAGYQRNARAIYSKVNQEFPNDAQLS